MRKKKYTSEYLDAQFMDVYNYIVIDTVVDDEGNGLYPDEIDNHNHYSIDGGESLLTSHRKSKQRLSV